jgi:hypothetical protein
MKIKQVSADSLNEVEGVYAITEDGRLLYGYWSFGKLVWKNITPEEDEIDKPEEGEDSKPLYG